MSNPNFKVQSAASMLASSTGKNAGSVSNRRAVEPERVNVIISLKFKDSNANSLIINFVADESYENSGVSFYTGYSIDFRKVSEQLKSSEYLQLSMVKENCLNFGEEEYKNIFSYEDMQSGTIAQSMQFMYKYNYCRATIWSEQSKMQVNFGYIEKLIDCIRLALVHPLLRRNAAVDISRVNNILDNAFICIIDSKIIILSDMFLLCVDTALQLKEERGSIYPLECYGIPASMRKLVDFFSRLSSFSHDSEYYINDTTLKETMTYVSEGRIFTNGFVDDCDNRKYLETEVLCLVDLSRIGFKIYYGYNLESIPEGYYDMYSYDLTSYHQFVQVRDYYTDILDKIVDSYFRDDEEIRSQDFDVVIDKESVRISHKCNLSIWFPYSYEELYDDTIYRIDALKAYLLYLKFFIPIENPSLLNGKYIEGLEEYKYAPTIKEVLLLLDSIGLRISYVRNTAGNIEISVGDSMIVCPMNPTLILNRGLSRLLQGN